MEYTIKRESSKSKLKYKWYCTLMHPYYPDYPVIISSYSYKSCKKKVLRRLNKWEVNKDDYKEINEHKSNISLK